MGAEANCCKQPDNVIAEENKFTSVHSTMKPEGEEKKEGEELKELSEQKEDAEQKKDSEEKKESEEKLKSSPSDAVNNQTNKDVNKETLVTPVTLVNQENATNENLNNQQEINQNSLDQYFEANKNNYETSVNLRSYQALQNDVLLNNPQNIQVQSEQNLVSDINYLNTNNLENIELKTETQPLTAILPETTNTEVHTYTTQEPKNFTTVAPVTYAEASFLPPITAPTTYKNEIELNPVEDLSKLDGGVTTNVVDIQNNVTDLQNVQSENYNIDYNTSNYNDVNFNDANVNNYNVDYNANQPVDLNVGVDTNVNLNGFTTYKEPIIGDVTASYQRVPGYSLPSITTENNNYASYNASNTGNVYL